MKIYFLIFLFCCVQLCFGQGVSTKLIQKVPLQATRYFGTDDYGNHYYYKNGIFYKGNGDKQHEFSDLKLGNVSEVDLINPLKLTLYYKLSNTVVFLDRHLIEIGRVNFGKLPYYRNIKFATTASNNDLWIYGLDTRRLEVLDYVQKKVIEKSQPISSEVIDQESNFNYCWLLTEDTLERYNRYGSLLKKMPNPGFVKIEENNGRIMGFKNNRLYLLPKKGTEFRRVILSKPNIQDFYLNDEKLYIYNGETLFIYRFKN